MEHQPSQVATFGFGGQNELSGRTSGSRAPLLQSGHHSYHLWPMMDETRALGRILFCSERERNRRLSRFLVDDMIGLFRSAAFDDIDEMETVRNKDLGDYDLVKAVNQHLRKARA